MTRRSYWSWWPVVIVAVAIPLVLQLLATFFAAFASQQDGFIGGLIGFIGVVCYLAGLLATALMILGLIRNAYEVSGGGAPSVARLFQIDHYGWFLVASLLYVGIVTLGLLLFIIPGLIIAFMLMLYGYSLVSGECGNGFAALGMSWDRIRHHFWGFVGLRVVLLGVPVGLLLVLFFMLGLVGAGVAGTSALFGGGAGAGILGVLLGLLGLVVLIFAYVFAVIFTVVADGLAFRRLAAQ
jgi:hypothetical protein